MWFKRMKCKKCGTKGMKNFEYMTVPMDGGAYRIIVLSCKECRRIK